MNSSDAVQAIRERLDTIRHASAHYLADHPDPDEADHRLWNDAGEMGSALTAVIDLHIDSEDDGLCTGCGFDSYEELRLWPCRTIFAVAAALGCGEQT